MKLEDGSINLPIDGGEYENLVTGKKINIPEGVLELPYVLLDNKSVKTY